MRNHYPIHLFHKGILNNQSFFDHLIGSTNLDLRSFDLTYENNVLIYDESVTTDIRQQDYINSSVPVNLASVNNGSYGRRLWNNVIVAIGSVV